MILKVNPEFGIELALAIPFAYWLHQNNQLDGVVTSKGMKPYYFFCDNVKEEFLSRTIDNDAALVGVPNNWIHHNALSITGKEYHHLTTDEQEKVNGVLDYGKWVSPPFKEYYKDKSIKFDTSDAGKTYTKTIYKKVTANRAQNASPEKRWGDDEIKKTKIISGKAATRQANRLAKKIENQPGTYQKMGGITKTTVVNRIGGVKKMQVKRNKKC